MVVFEIVGVDGGVFRATVLECPRFCVSRWTSLFRIRELRSLTTDLV